MSDKYYCVIDADGFYKKFVLVNTVPGPGKLILDLGDIGAAHMKPSSWEDISAVVPEKELSACTAISNYPYMGRTEDERIFCYAPSIDGEAAALLIIDPEHDAVFSFVGPLTRMEKTLTLKNADTDASITFTFEWQAGGMVEQIQGYTLAEGESLVARTDACRQPIPKPYVGAPGFVRPRWDGAAWVEGATEAEIIAWELEHPAPETITWEPEHPAPETTGPDGLTQTQLAVAELAQVVEDNNTANQLAIAELAEALMGGEPGGETVR